MNASFVVFCNIRNIYRYFPRNNFNGNQFKVSANTKSRITTSQNCKINDERGKQN